jgi:hypothetical protein
MKLAALARCCDPHFSFDAQATYPSQRPEMQNFRTRLTPADTNTNQLSPIGTE